MRKFSLIIILVLSVFNISYSQDHNYDWTGAVDGNFYNSANWTGTFNSAPFPVVFDNSSFFFVRTHDVSTNAPVISSFVDWQPGVFDNTGGTLTVNAPFNCFFNDKLNGTVTINTGGIFTGRNQLRVGRDGTGTVNVNGGEFKIESTEVWQAILVGVNENGDGTLNITNNGIVLCQNLEVGTRDGYPLGVLNLNDGTATATVGTPIGPNGIVNINGGTLNTGSFLIVGDDFGTAGTTNKTTDFGNLNINSGTVMFNQNDAPSPYFSVRDGAKLTIAGGNLKLKQTGYDFTSDINALITLGKILAPAGKTITVTYDGSSITTVTAIASLPVSLTDFTVKLENSKVLINWITSSEQNNSHFNVNHSTDGRDFTLLSTVEASTDGNKKSSYSYSHLSPQSGTNYYQLQQTDKDGKTKDLGIRVVNFSLAKEQQVLVYPNPAQTTATVSFANNLYTVAKLLDVNGSVIAKKPISVDDTEVTFDIVSLNVGNYFIRLEGKQNVTEKLVKQ